MNFGFEIGDKVQILKYSMLGFSHMNYGECAEIIEFPNIPVGSINLVGFKPIKVKTKNGTDYGYPEEIKLLTPADLNSGEDYNQNIHKFVTKEPQDIESITRMYYSGASSTLNEDQRYREIRKMLRILEIEGKAKINEETGMWFSSSELVSSTEY